MRRGSHRARSADQRGSIAGSEARTCGYGGEGHEVMRLNCVFRGKKSRANMVSVVFSNAAVFSLKLMFGWRILVGKMMFSFSHKYR